MDYFKKEEWATIHEVKVKWGEMDSFGHVNNTVYFRYFEDVRIAYFHEVQFKMPSHTGKFGPILAHASCQFLRPVFHPDTVRIGIRTKKLGNSSIVHEYEVYSTQQKTLVATGESVIVCFDFDKNEKVAIPQELRERIVALEGTLV